MSRPVAIIAFGAGLAMLAALVPAGRGAPILPSSPLADQVRSLAGLSTLRLVVDPVSDELAAMDVDAEDLAADRRAGLRRAGFQVLDESDQAERESTLPRLTIQIIGVQEPKLPDAIAFSVNLMLEQEVRIERLDRVMAVPTYVRHATALVPKEEARKTIDRTTDHLVDQFLKWTHKATERQ